MTYHLAAGTRRGSINPVELVRLEGVAARALRTLQSVIDERQAQAAQKASHDQFFLETKAIGDMSTITAKWIEGHEPGGFQDRCTRLCSQNTACSACACAQPPGSHCRASIA